MHTHLPQWGACMCLQTSLWLSATQTIHITAKAARCHGPCFISWGTQQTLCVVAKTLFITKTCFLWISKTSYQLSDLFLNAWQTPESVKHTLNTEESDNCLKFVCLYFYRHTNPGHFWSSKNSNVLVFFQTVTRSGVNFFIYIVLFSNIYYFSNTVFSYSQKSFIIPVLQLKYNLFPSN